MSLDLESNVKKIGKKRKNTSKNNNNPKKPRTSDTTAHKNKKHKNKIPHEWPKKPESQPKKYDVEMLEEKIAHLETIEDPPGKIRKKLRQLKFLHKKITQIELTQQSLSLLDEPNHDIKEKGLENNEDSENDDLDTEVVIKEKDSGSDTQVVTENRGDGSDTDEDVGKGLKRFVVFVGNLPKDIKEEDLKQHFTKVGTIKSIRIPNSKEFRKNGFAFVELEDNITYEKTLSMHHTMLNNRRINVMYTNPDGKNLDKQEVHKKNAKLNALRKAGKLAGSIPEHQRRSFRRKKKRLAEAKANAE